MTHLQTVSKEEEKCSISIMRTAQDVERAFNAVQSSAFYGRQKSSDFDIHKVETTIEQAVHCNKQINEPSRLPESRQKRIGEYESMSGQQIQKVYLKTHRKTVVKRKLKALMPYKLKLLIRSKRKECDSMAH